MSKKHSAASLRSGFDIIAAHETPSKPHESDMTTTTRR